MCRMVESHVNRRWGPADRMGGRGIGEGGPRWLGAGVPCGRGSELGEGGPDYARI